MRSALHISALSIGLLVGACDRGAPVVPTPAESPGAPSDEAGEAADAQPAEEQAASDSPRAHMRHHFERVVLAQDALIAGDVRTARDHLRQVADHEPVEGLPAGGQSVMQMLRRAAAEGARGASHAEVADGFARALRQCGGCHQAVGQPVDLPPQGLTEIGGDVQAAMHRHVWAIDRLMDGLVAPSALSWQVGAEALHEEAISEDAVPGPQARALAGRLHELGGKARDERDSDRRAALYGQMLGTCASCHALAGPPAPTPK